MAKIVVDANVIISAAFGGKSLEAVVRALEDHEVYTSEAVAQELLGVLSGLSKKLSEDQLSFIHEKIQQLLTLATYVSLLPTWSYQGIPRMIITALRVNRWGPNS